LSKAVKYILLLILLTGGFSLFSGTSSGVAESYAAAPDVQETQQQPTDTAVRFPVKRTQVTTYDDLSASTPIDLRDPSNVKTEIEYDLKSNTYLFKTKVGDQVWTTPFSMTLDEYNDYSLKQSMANYFKIKNNETMERGTTADEFALKDIRIPLGAAEKIFGPGGVKIRPQGYVEFSMGVKRNTTKDPTISEKRRTNTIFDVDQKINLSVNASIGDKMNFNLNYNTEATFDFDSKKMKLAYEGKEDEIVKYLEAGNVSLNTTNSLITGANALFGIRADLQFGKLRVNTVISQQESESKSVGSKGGVQTTPFEFRATDYEENRHFFLGNYFRDTYDGALEKLPYIESSIQITRMEVWVTNKRGNYDQARNVVAFADLAETDSIKNGRWLRIGSDNFPYNKVNTLYSTVADPNGTFLAARDINQVTQIMENESLKVGLDYEKVESARLLSSSEYTYNDKLGYVSLTGYSLQADEVLAVAYTYVKGTTTYQVGEFASEITDKYNADGKSGALIVKLLKPVSMSPSSYTWHLMMKNIYTLRAYQVQKDRFRLNISYQSDTTGTYINYIPEGNIKSQILIKVMNLDRLDSNQRVVSKEENGENIYGDGIFDFVEGYTITASNGRIIFPVVEPFGEHLRKKIGNDGIAQKYIYQELYTMSLTDAKQVAEKDKFKISGSYKASNNNEIDLGVTNVVRGSVVVTAGGRTLTEGVEYTVDYMSGIVTIIDQSLIDSRTAINASVENQSYFNMQRKTMLGLNLSYEFSKDFNIGTTIMHMYEKPLTTKAGIGSESVKNTLVGFNASYRTESQWLTNLIDKIPFVEATVPSKIAFDGEFAQMLPGHYKNEYGGGYSYLDDFESSRSRISVRDPYAWTLASIPYDRDNFTEINKAIASNNILEYGKNRALLSWYYIDNLFTRKNSSLVPQHIKSDKEQLSNHYVREVRVRELYPNRDGSYNETSTIPVLNLSFYPEQRGPYNLDADSINDEGKLLYPKNRWGGMTRKIDSKDFETSNVEYIEFWLMDPFIYNKDSIGNAKNPGGYLYFNLGEVSEDILKDGRKFYENGLPFTDDPTLYDETVWGRVPKRQSTVYAFDKDKSNDVLRAQDVGFNGLSTDQEKEFTTYKEYLEKFRQKLNSAALIRLENDLFSPLNDPAGDNFHYFRGSDYDENEVSILDRYKYINGTEMNTVGSGNESYSTSMKSSPDVEDIDQDNTMNETEAYYEYKVKLTEDALSDSGNDYITDVREVAVDLANGKTETIKWYQFKIPIREKYEKKGNGSISGFNSIRFMRMYMKGFEKTTHLRFGSLDLVRGEWRTYTQNLQTDKDEGAGTIVVTSVNIEENGDRTPVNYVLPPGVSRILDPGQPQLRQENEQSLAIQISDLQDGRARAVYRNTSYDLRRYKRLQMFTHAESMKDKQELKNGDLSVFLRLGSDYKNNYYEYEIQLTVTPEGKYIGTNNADQLIVWPKDNMFDFPLDLLKNVKLNRNKEKRKAGSSVSYTSLYHEYDPEKPTNKVSVIGNPSLAEINVIMVGIRNNTNQDKSGEIWVNELRVTDFDEEGGWAAKGSLNIALSDIGTVTLTGHKETAGFGSIEQSLLERRSDDFYTYSISTNIDLGRFIPEKAKVTLPMYYTYTNETTTPKYDPLDKDVTMDEALSSVNTKAEKDSIKSLAQERHTSKNFSISGAKVNIRSKTPMPYDPANFTFGYSQSITETKDPNTVYDQVKNYSAKFNYTYSPMVKTWQPFKNSKSKAPMSKFAKNLGFNYMPSNITINSDINRYYTETVIRDLEAYMIGGDTKDSEILSFSSNFYWDRDLSITWDFTKNLKASIQTGTKAEIEEPFLQVNKKANPDDYDLWKDAVDRSIRNFGTPLSYRQNASLTYNMPLSDIPFLDWANASANYVGTYNWDRGADTGEESYEIGNTLNNTMSLTLNGRFNMLTLYNKSPFLKKVNQKFGGTSSSRGGATRPAATKRPDNKKKFEKVITLNPDSAVVLKHNLRTKNIRVTARRDDNNRLMDIKFKKVDDNTIRITTKDSVNVKVNIVQGPDAEENTWYKIAQYTTRGLMSVRNISIAYTKRNETSIYGYRPGVGDFFGQSSSMVPGLGFAFGLDGGEDFFDKSFDKGRIISESNISPSIFNEATKLNINATLEPLRGLKIDLKAFREKNDQTSLRVYTDGSSNTTSRTRSLGGSFSMSISSLSSAFESINADNDYYSATFEKFLQYRETLQKRIQDKYGANGTIQTYPDKGFIQDHNLGNNNYDPANGAIELNSADVLIPAFVAAYTGKNPNKVSLSPFLAISSMIPEWAITYDGLTTLPWFKDKFKNFKLMHSYSSRYQIGSYSSFSEWVSADGNWGFKQSNLATSDIIIPSSPYDINSVNIVENFSPLFGVEGTLNNSMTLKARYNKGRSVTLNISSFQIVESLQNEVVVGMAYRINEFNRLIGLTARNSKGFNNDLNITADVSYKKTQALLRKIEEHYTQATSGVSITTIKLSADYSMSKSLTLRGYFDKVINNPLVSASAFPTSETNFGISIRFNLTQ